VSESKALAGRIAIVTGGTRGIGLAIARALAEDGASVVVSGRDAARLDSALKEIEATGAVALALAADQSKREDCDRLLEATKERFGRIDVLVNNAGITRDQLLMRLHVDHAGGGQSARGLKVSHPLFGRRAKIAVDRDGEAVQGEKFLDPLRAHLLGAAFDRPVEIDFLGTRILRNGCKTSARPMLP
jgi:NAD(P)-dependent dehydrogenase (short-subunit alcohol dehydrogenase family)